MSLRLRFDSTIDRIFGWYYGSKTQKLPGPLNRLVLESATSLAQKIRNREITSEEVVKAFIERIGQVNPLINAVVDERFVEAIEEAKEIDQEIGLGRISEEGFERQPLLGVPFTVKEAIACQQLSHTFGLPSRRSHKASYDAKTVASLKKSGAILLAVTNIPQLSVWYETANPIYGLTKNPYDFNRTAGGSSGGEAAIVAACGSPLGLGTDLAGSLRNPAFMCGIFAHKPTSGLTSVHGVLFNEKEKERTMASTGPLVKTSEDLILVMKVLVGDTFKTSDVIKDVRIYYVIDDIGDCLVSTIVPEVREAFLKVVRFFEQTLTEKPRVIQLGDLKYGGRLWHYWIGQEESVDLCSDLTNRKHRIRVWSELLKFLFRRSDFNLGTMLPLIGSLLPKQNPHWAITATNELQKQLMDILGENGVLLYPSSPFVAPYHYSTVFRPCNNNLYSIWNALKFPVTQVPIGLSKNGLPLGLQIVGAPNQDHLTLAVAQKVEKAFGGYIPPF